MEVLRFNCQDGKGGVFIIQENSVSSAFFHKLHFFYLFNLPATYHPAILGRFRSIEENAQGWYNASPKQSSTASILKRNNHFLLMQYSAQWLKRWLSIAMIGTAIAVFYSGLILGHDPLQGLQFFFVFVYLIVFFCIVVYFVLYRFALPRLHAYSRRWKLLWAAGSLLAGLWLTHNIPVPYSPASNLVPIHPILFKAVSLACSGVFFGLTLFVFSAWLVTRESPIHAPAQQRPWQWVWYALPMLVVWGIYLLAYWPGMLSADSINQWGQMLSGNYVDHHPVFHTLTIWLLTRLAPSPAIVAAAQILFLALVAGYGLAFIETLGVPRGVLWLASALFALTPVNGTMVTILWKDIPYSTALLGLTLVILKIVQTRGAWLNRPGRWVILGVFGFLAAILRHNGLPVVVATAALLPVFFHRQWKLLLFAVVLGSSLYLIVRGPVYQLINVRSSSMLLEATTSLYTVAARSDPGSDTDRILREIRPFSTGWDCNIITNLFEVDRTIALEEGPKGSSLLNLVRYAPNLAMYVYRCNRGLIWVISDPTAPIYNTSHVHQLVDPNPYGILPDSKLPLLEDRITQFVLNSAADPDLKWFFWRPALYLYIFLGVVAFLTLKRKDFRFLLIAAPLLLQSVASTLMLIRPNFRYHYAAYLIALVFWPILFERTGENRNLSESPVEAETPNNH